MFGAAGEGGAPPGGCNLPGGRSGASLSGAQRKKTCPAVYSGTCRSGQAPTPPHTPPTTSRHLSLNTPLMKVIHFNGASFQTAAIKARAALGREVVGTARGRLLQINSRGQRAAAPTSPSTQSSDGGEMKSRFLSEAGRAGGANMSGRKPEPSPLTGSERWKSRRRTEE